MPYTQTVWQPHIQQLGGSSGHRAPHLGYARDKGSPRTLAAACVLWWSSSWQNQPLCARSGNGRGSVWSSACQPQHKVQNFVGGQDLNKTKVTKKWAILLKNGNFWGFVMTKPQSTLQITEWIITTFILLALMSGKSLQKICKIIPRFHKLYEPQLVPYLLYDLLCGRTLNELIK